MKKLLSLLVLTAIHYSALGNYLVDQDGNRVTIKGHPQMVCYIGKDEEIYGVYQKTRILHEGVVLYVVGWSRKYFEETGKHKKMYFAIPNPVCDIK